MSRPAKPALPAAGDQRGGGRRGRAARQSDRPPPRLQDTQARQSDPRGLLREFSGFAGGTGQLYHQGPGDDSGQVHLQCPDEGRDGVVR